MLRFDHWSVISDNLSEDVEGKQVRCGVWPQTNTPWSRPLQVWFSENPRLKLLHAYVLRLGHTRVMSANKGTRVPRWKAQLDAALEKEDMGTAKYTTNTLAPRTNCVY